MAFHTDLSADIRKYFDEVSGILSRTGENSLSDIAGVLINAYSRGATVFTAGNGGSSATASHMVNDLTKGCAVYGRPGFKSMCLSDSSTLLTCLANDYSYEDAYKIMLSTLGKRAMCSGFHRQRKFRECCARGAIRSPGRNNRYRFLGKDGGKTLPLAMNIACTYRLYGAD